MSVARMSGRKVKSGREERQRRVWLKRCHQKCQESCGVGS